MDRAVIGMIFGGVLTLSQCWPGLLQALCVELNDRVQTLYSQADLVFVGTLTKKTILADQEDGDTLDYTFSVKDWMKGGKEGSIRLQEGNDSGRTDYEEGKTYLVFAAKWTDRGATRFKEVTARPLGYGCAGADAFAFPGAEKKVEEARETRAKQSQNGLATIRVRVLERATGLPIKNSLFIVSGGGRQRKGKTDKEGWLWMDLPAGMYTIQAKGPGQVVTQHFEQREVRFKVGPGGGWDQLFFR